MANEFRSGSLDDGQVYDLSLERADDGGTDFRSINHVSIVMVEPVSNAAKEWVSEHVQLEDWQWFGGAFSVEPRYASDLIEGIRGDGLTVNGR